MNIHVHVHVTHVDKYTCTCTCTPCMGGGMVRVEKKINEIKHTCTFKKQLTVRCSSLTTTSLDFPCRTAIASSTNSSGTSDAGIAGTRERRARLSLSRCLSTTSRLLKGLPLRATKPLNL